MKTPLQPSQRHLQGSPPDGPTRDHSAAVPLDDNHEEALDRELNELTADGSLDTGVLLAGCLRVEELARLQLLRAFQSEGVFQRNGERYNLRELKQRLAVVAEYERLFDVLLEMLARHDFLSIDDDDLTVAGLPDTSLRACAALQEEVLAAFPDRAILMRLVEACVAESLAVVSGRKSAVEVLFPGGSAALVEDVYANDDVSSFFNRLVANSVHATVRSQLSRQPGKGLSILEIGAGTGGTSSAVLAKLRPLAGNVSYDYTDLSTALLHGAQDRFGSAYPFVEFKPLDIDRAPDRQGFQSGIVDVALAANVLHATRDIAATLSHVRDLLRPNGVLIINEVTRVFDFTTLTFGLMPGWWLFEDSANRLPGSPLLSSRGWRRALSAAGFIDVRCFTPFDAGSEPQCLILAKTNGKKRAVAAAPHAASHPLEDQVNRLEQMQQTLEGPMTSDVEVRNLIGRQLEILQRQLQLLLRRRS